MTAPEMHDTAGLSVREQAKAEATRLLIDLHRDEWDALVEQARLRILGADR